MNTATVLTSVDVLVSAMAADGWKQSPPPDRFAEKIDKDVAAESTCDACDHVGGHYVPFVQSDPQVGRTPAYRAFSVCNGCGNASEF